MKYYANAVFVGRVDATFMVALSEREDGSGASLVIQRADGFDRQDRELGMDAYCVSCNGLTVYGGVVGWSCTDGVVDVRFSNDAASSLGLRAQLSIGFARRKTGLVREGLGLVLRDAKHDA